MSRTIPCSVCGEQIAIVKWYGMNGKLKSATHDYCLELSDAHTIPTNMHQQNSSLT